MVGEPFTNYIVRVSRSPLTLSAAIISRTFTESIDAPSRAMLSALPRSPDGWPWKSTTGYFAFHFMPAAGTISVDLGR